MAVGWLYLRRKGGTGRLLSFQQLRSRWRAPLVLPLLALVQVTFALLAKLTGDRSSCLGWSAVASKPAER